jgi:AAA family ATP:ADP antiporter
LSSPESTRILARVRGLFGDIRPGEGTTVLLLAANVFLLLTSYYLLKVVREPLILVGGGAEVKSYSAAGQAILLLGVVKGFDALTRRYGRMKLITVTMLFYVVSLAIFFTLGILGIPIGVPFYLWLGVFNMSAVAQFWSLANDVYTTEQGKRLFAMIGVGASVGAVIGAWLARAVYPILGPYVLMLVAAAVLLVCLALAWAVDRRERPVTKTSARVSDEPLGDKTALQLLLADKYLMGIAVLVFLMNLINTNGEYILDRTLLDAGRAMVSDPAELQNYVARFKGGFYVWVNIFGVGMQLFLVSRLLKYLGLKVAVFVLPAVVLLGYSALFLAPMLGVIRIAKIAENSVDYSVQNTTRHALFLPTSRAAKFNVKAFIDGFLVRMSDVASSGIVFLSVWASLATRSLILINLGVIVAALVAATAMSRLVRQREDAAPAT